MRSIIAGLLVLFSIIGVRAENPSLEIKNKRVALFYDEQFPWRGNPKTLAWYQETLSTLGLNVTILNAKELEDEKLITRRRFDSVFLPDGSSFPIKAEYTLTAFLAEGGNLVVGELQEEVKAYDEQKASWSKTYGWEWYTIYSEWQLRRVRSLGEKGRRGLGVPLTRNTQIPEALQARLPQTAGPFASNEWFQVLDRVNGNLDITHGGKDINAAANIIWPMYFLPNGEKADFIGYRHHNLLLNGSTLVVLGKTGRLLLNTDAAAGVIYAAFKMCELPFPGEQSAEYYQCLFELQKTISRLSAQYVDVNAALADAALVAFYRGQPGRYLELKNQLIQADKDFYDLLSAKRKTDMQLVEEDVPEQQDAARKEILKRSWRLKNQFQGLVKAAEKETNAIRTPDKVTVTNATCDRLHFDAGSSAPFGWYMLRKHYFQTIKELGVNTARADRRLPEYFQDPQIRKNSEGVKFTVAFGNYATAYSRFDPVTGLIKEIEDVKKRGKYYDQPLDNTEYATNFPAFVAKWKDIPVYRYYLYDALFGEGGLDTMYWGAKARQDYQAYLAQKYATIQSLNQRWKSSYPSFGEIQAPLHQPQTEMEHGNWEDWTVFRDGIYNQKRKGVYELSKQNSPDIPVSVVMSIGVFSRPYMGGNNLYLFTQNQDISGMDGAYLAVSPGEWTWFDLNRGIPFHSPEWGIFYSPSVDPRQWQNTLTEEWWAQFTGGAAGVGCYVWSWAGYCANSVDIVGLPTLTGWHVKKLIGDVNRFDHLIIDGKRPAALRILYSNTCRRHDQGWGDGKSKHQNTVNSLYYMFMRWQWPARVLAEEALNEGKDLSTTKLLLVPQAEYLKESTQNQLLDYVRGGGNLLIEGYSGKLDNYGQASAKLFAAVNVKCFPASSDVAVINGEEISLGAVENAYRLETDNTTDKRVLIRYADKSPAVVSCSLGKGRLVFSGIPFGLLNMNEDARRIMNGINDDLKLAPICEGRDTRLVIREWEYRGQTYLICYYPNAHANLLQECTLKIRGACKIHDYLLGMEVPSQTDKKNTVMRFVMPVPGVRVFRLDPLSPEQLAQIKTTASLGEIPAEQSGGADASQAHMPYKGFLYEGRPLEIDGYKIEVIVIRKGEADLIVRKGTDTVRRRINADKALQFGFIEDAKQYDLAVDGNTLTVFSKAISDTLPIGVDIEIRETKGVVSKESICSLQQAGGIATLQNGLLRIEVNAELGGRVSALVTEQDGINHVAADKGPKTGIIETTMYIPGLFSGVPFSCEVVTNTADAIEMQLLSRENADDQRAAKRFRLRSGEAAFSASVDVTLEGAMERKMRLRMQSVLGVGGAADYCDNMYLPVAGGTTNIPYTPGAGTAFMTPAGNWVGVVDRKQKMALVEQFLPDEIKNIYMWMDKDFYTMELFKPLVPVKPGQTEKLQVRFMIFPGMTALDMVTNDMAVALNVPAAGLKPEQDIVATVEIGSALAATRPVCLELVLMKNGVQKQEVGKWDGKVAYDKPAMVPFAVSGKYLAEAGQYALRLDVIDSKGGIIGTVVKNIRPQSSRKEGKE